MDSKEGELDVLNTEVLELEARLADLRAARAGAAAAMEKNHALRQQEERELMRYRTWIDGAWCFDVVK